MSRRPKVVKTAEQLPRHRSVPGPEQTPEAVVYVPTADAPLSCCWSDRGRALTDHWSDRGRGLTDHWSDKGTVLTDQL